MTKENNLKEELLKQMEKDSDKIPEANTKSSKEIIAKDLARIKRLIPGTGSGFQCPNQY